MSVSRKLLRTRLQSSNVCVRLRVLGLGCWGWRGLQVVCGPLPPLLVMLHRLRRAMDLYMESTRIKTRALSLCEGSTVISAMPLQAACHQCLQVDRLSRVRFHDGGIWTLSGITSAEDSGLGGLNGKIRCALQARMWPRYSRRSYSRDGRVWRRQSRAATKRPGPGDDKRKTSI